jgi:hypothetical protein
LPTADSGGIAVSSTTSDRAPQMRHSDPMNVTSATYAGIVDSSPSGVR